VILAPEGYRSVVFCILGTEFVERSDVKERSREDEDRNQSCPCFHGW